ncbi:FAD binding domain-containing protein [Deinococcus sp.]|uniref:xanthine dehydrogenase small subunit n=1 Tax=Deinococcus sp. TaxID=47478 RepID=UPI0025C0B996|nr:FAD binding domain-containing protein [Deinococcus sp.]
MEQFTLSVNGQRRPLGQVSPQTNLLGWLRSQGLTGSKEGCAEGECGACAVLVACPELGAGGERQTRWEALNSCLTPVLALAGREIMTAEGLGTPEQLHPVQREMATRGGSQCGYCTPGFVVSMAAEYYRPDRSGGEHGVPNGFDLHALSGNLCRCTGYRPIQDAAYALERPAPGDPLAQRCTLPTAPAAEHQFSLPEGAFYQPPELRPALEFLAAHPAAKVVAGNTDWGVEVNIRHARTPVTLSIGEVQELKELRWHPERVEIGAGLTLSQIERGLGGRVPLLAQLFPQFASRLIRNAATLGGNLGTASPIGDSPPALLALNAALKLVSVRGEREVPLRDYFTGYRQTARQPDELIRSVVIPLPLATHTAFHKIAKRRFDDISSVAVAFALDIDGGVVRRARIGLGGVAATPLRALKTEAALEGQPWTESTVQAAAAVLATEGTPLDDHRASARYRAAMLGQALLRFWEEQW